MDILSPDLLRIAWNISLILAAMSGVVLILTIVVRLQAQTATERTKAFRHKVEPLVAAYLAKRESSPAVVAALQRDPSQALSLLMEISDRLAPADRKALHNLFACLPLRKKEATALHSRQWDKRLKAAERLGYLGDGVSGPALVDALQDPVLAVRLAAARSLGNLGETRAIVPILVAFDLPGEMNQRRLAEALYAFGPAAVEPLLGVLANVHGTYSDNAIGVAERVLGMLRAPEAVKPLTTLLTHPEFRVRLNAARSLGQIGDHTDTAPIARLAKDPAWEVRNVVMQSLGKLHGTRHIKLMEEGMRDTSWWVRFSAAQALWELGGPGRETLHRAMDASPDRFARDMSRQILQEHGSLSSQETHAS
jgi:HEAT repeat protein